MLVFDHDSEGKVITLRFSGRMDTLAAAKVNEIMEAEPLLENRQPDEKIVFDLQDVDYIASSFMRICINQARLAGAGMFSIAHCQPFVKKTFMISGLDELLHIS
jgi:anti-anti-sigma factor